MNQSSYRPRVYIQEVAPRDGFQNERTFIPTEAKIDLIDALSRTGVDAIEVASFTSPRAIPALADEWTTDGGHLNAAGGRRAAARLLVTLASLPEGRGVESTALNQP